MAQIIVNIIVSTSIYVLIALSFVVIYYPTKFFNIAHAATIVIPTYLTYFFARQLDLSLWIAIPLSVALVVVLGLLSEVCIYRPLRRREANSMMLLIASIGLHTLLQNSISMFWGDNIKSIRVEDTKVGNQFLGAYITDIQIVTILVSAIIFIGYVLFQKYNKIGRNIRAVSSNPELSNVLGIDSKKVILEAFAIASAIAGVTGILVVFDTDMTPTMGFDLLLYGVVAMIIGGVGSIGGLTGGALLLAIAQHLSAFYIGSQWMDAVAYFILILFLLLNPFGFSGKRLKQVDI